MSSDIPTRSHGTSIPVITYSSGDYEIGNLIGFFPTWLLLSQLE
jgi:hypothetical protein